MTNNVNKLEKSKRKCSKINFEDNCFDYIRIFCALTIFLGHFVTDYNVPSKVLDFLAYFVRGVPVFFVLSGFLVAHSIEKYDIKEFLIRRFFRIYPSMWVCIAINTVIILIVNPYKPSLIDFLIYIITQFTVCQFFTGGGYWLREYGVGVPNGALWTITVDVQFYLSVYIIAKFMKNKSIKFWVSAIGILSTISVILEKLSPMMPEIAYKLLMVTIFPFLYIFMFGMMVYNFRERLLPLFVKYKWTIIAIYTVWELLPDRITNCVYGVRYNAVTTLLLMSTVFAVGYGFGKHRVKTDYTFAFYLYHIVVINLIVELGVTSITNPLVFITVFVSELIAIMILSYFSAHVIERRVSNALLNKALLNGSNKNGTVKK